MQTKSCSIVLSVDISRECEYSQDMEQMALFDPSPRWTVSTLTHYLRELLESDASLQGVWVQGEISNLSRPSSGHIYFTLKDSGASLRCVMWRGEAVRLRFAVQDGLAVEAHGNISLYEAGGQYQLYVDSIGPIGEGALYQEFVRLKALLEAEGLFNTARKRSIPQFPRKIGIVTSPSGAALRDVLNTLRRRLPLAEVVLAPTPVQGDEAAPAIVSALQNLNRVCTPDVILLARGGGSIEDLWAFNDERVVRAIVGSVAPVITGIGHETDFTLADFASDLRAPTPTAAAELATPITVLDLNANLSKIRGILASGMAALFQQKREIDSLVERPSASGFARKTFTDRTPTPGRDEPSLECSPGPPSGNCQGENQRNREPPPGAKSFGRSEARIRSHHEGRKGCRQCCACQDG